MEPKILSRQEFRRDFFQELEEEDIEYCILRNEEALEEETENPEIDIMLRNEDLEGLRRIIDERMDCREIGFKPDTTHPLLVQVVGEDFELKLDFQVRGIGFCGTYVLKAEDLLEKREKKDDIYTLGEPEYFLHLFTHSFLYHGEFGKYRDELQQLSGKEENRERLKELYGREQGEKFLEHLETGDFGKILKYRRRYMSKFLVGKLSQIPDFTVSLAIRAGNKYGIWKALRTLNPFNRAPLASFMGVDKSGKSTLSGFAVEEIERWNYEVEKVSGSVFQQYPPMSWLNKLRKSKESGGEDQGGSESSYDEKVSEDHAGSSHLEAMFRLSNAVITCLKISLKRQRGIWVVTDRYIWDLVFFTAAPQPWERLMRLFFPDPELPFQVKVSDETLEKRDCELNQESRKKIMERFEDRKEEYGLLEVENENLEEAKARIREELLPVLHDNNLKY